MVLSILSSNFSGYKRFSNTLSCWSVRAHLWNTPKLQVLDQARQTQDSVQMLPGSQVLTGSDSYTKNDSSSQRLVFLNYYKGTQRRSERHLYRRATPVGTVST